MMQELLDQLEAANAPHRMLDAMIECELRKVQAYEIGMSDKVRSHWRPIDERGEVIDNQELTRYHAPEYTFSVDKAVLLVPAGYPWGCSQDKSEAFGWCGSVPGNGKHITKRAVLAAPALCFAALKMRYALLGRQD